MAYLHTYKICDREITKELTIGKAIKEHCVDCSGGIRADVRTCTIPTCALYPFRFGKDPGRKKIVLSEERKQAMLAQLHKNK